MAIYLGVTTFESSVSHLTYAPPTPKSCALCSEKFIWHWVTMGVHGTLSVWHVHCWVDFRVQTLHGLKFANNTKKRIEALESLLPEAQRLQFYQWSWYIDSMSPTPFKCDNVPGTVNTGKPKQHAWGCKCVSAPWNQNFSKTPWTMAIPGY